MPPRYYSMNNAGQMCISVERVYVEAPVYDEFVAARDRERRERSARARRPATGRSRSARSSSRRSSRSIESPRPTTRVARRADPGRRAAAAGERPLLRADGLLGVDHSMACMREETFGPVVPIMRVDDVEEAVRARQRLAVRAAGERLDRATSARRGARAPAAGRRGLRQRRPDQLHRAGPAPMGGWKPRGSAAATVPPGIRKYCPIRNRC